MEPEEAAAHVAAAEAAVRAVKLDVIERLLWATDFGSGVVGGKPSLPPGDSPASAGRVICSAASFSLYT